MQRVRSLVRQGGPAEPGAREREPSGEPPATASIDDHYSAHEAELQDVKTEKESARSKRLRLRNSSSAMQSLLQREPPAEPVSVTPEHDVAPSSFPETPVTKVPSSTPAHRRSTLPVVRKSHICSEANDPEDCFKRANAEAIHSGSAQTDSEKNLRAKAETLRHSESGDTAEPTSIAAAAELHKPRTRSGDGSSEREKILMAQVKELQSELHRSQTANAEQALLIRRIVKAEYDVSQSPLPPHLALHVFARYFDANALTGSCRALIAEASPCSLSARRTMLWDRLQTRRFAEAVQLAEDVMSIELDPADAPSRRPRLNAAFEDLLYVLTKYLCIYLIQIEEVAAASKVLNGILRPKVERERAGTSRGRGEWFIRDLNLLGDLIDGQGSGLPGETNPYAGLDWVREFEGFWGAARLWRRSHLATADPDAEHTGPLFARALGEFFCDAAFDEAPSDAPSDLSLPVMYDSYSTWQGVRSYLVEHEDSRASRVTRSSGFVARKVKAPKSQPTSGGKREGSAAIGSTSDVSALVVKPAEQRRNTVQQSNQTNDKTQRPPFDANPATIEGITDSAQGVSQRQTSAEPNRKGRRGSRAGLSDEHDRASGASHFSVHGKNDADMPPQPVQLSSADFALASTCGPVMNEIRALDVTCVPETGEVIAATAGSHDRSDRRISLWDVRRGTLLAHLDNATSKPITCLAFHPDDPRLLLSADMEFDVKLWEWRSGTLLRSWKKMHTRIIFRTAFVPSSAGAAAPGSLAVASDRAATCSGDQSIKIFALNEDDLTPTSSVHANEPFTSFIFVGSATDPAQMKLVASLSYSIRIYRLRTATLLHTIQMKDLRDNKTPITALAAHPVHDAYVLISCDNQLRLVNLLTETTVKIYQSRAIPTGTRVDGQFSPCGGWVYCGTWDVKGRVKKDRDQSSSSTSRSESGGGGIVVWKLHTARADRVESAGVDVAVCKWIAATENSRAGDHRVIARKVLVAAGLDRMIRMYM